MCKRTCVGYDRVDLWGGIGRGVFANHVLLVLVNQGKCVTVEPEAEGFCEGLSDPFFFQLEFISEETMNLLEVAVLSRLF